MPETPKRSLRETIGQLLVIVILIGVLIGAIILLEQFIHSHDNSQSLSKSTFNLTCCTRLNTTAFDHPGEVRHLASAPAENRPSAVPAETIAHGVSLDSRFDLMNETA
jgi:hypothetical protein